MVEKIKSILPNDATVIYFDKENRIYVCVENFNEEKFNLFQIKLFKLFSESNIKEIWITEFYRQFSIYFM